MKENFLKYSMLLCLISVFCIMSVQNIQASTREVTDFAGSAGYSYTLVSAANEKNKLGNFALVNWEYSNKDSHKMWFRVVNGVAEQRGKELFKYLEQRDITTSGTAVGYDYYLQAAREHITNPKTYVSGAWTS